MEMKRDDVLSYKNIHKNMTVVAGKAMYIHGCFLLL
jgi:hypothetical protein